MLVDGEDPGLAYIRDAPLTGPFNVEESRDTLTPVQANAVASYLSELTAGEDDALRHARERAAAGGMPPVSADTGAFLRLAARWVDAQAAVEIGSGAGYSGIWLARGLASKGTLTTIEADPDHQRLAKASYEEAQVSGRIRAILGQALDVLPRLSDGGYDLAFIDARKDEYPAYLDHALRLVRPGGVILADNVLWSGRVADTRASDPSTEGLRLYARRIAEDKRLESVILTIGDGLATSLVRRPDEPH
jgi:predicted O-methyltransferase YrrM